MPWPVPRARDNSRFSARCHSQPPNRHVIFVGAFPLTSEVDLSINKQAFVLGLSPDFCCITRVMVLTTCRRLKMPETEHLVQSEFETLFQRDYSVLAPDMRRLYENAKRDQWNVSKDIDWAQ